MNVCRDFSLIRQSDITTCSCHCDVVIVQPVVAGAELVVAAVAPAATANGVFEARLLLLHSEVAAIGPFHLRHREPGICENSGF